MATKGTPVSRTEAAKSDLIAAYRNRQRREVYAASPEGVRTANRERYQQEHPPRNPLAGGLLSHGIRREVYAPNVAPRVIECYTVAEAAVALGRGLATIRRWTQEGRIPRPRLKESAHRAGVYSRGELNIIGSVMREYGAQGDYLTETSPVVHTIALRMQAYRQSTKY
jgi:hypothetical protein